MALISAELEGERRLGRALGPLRLVVFDIVLLIGWELAVRLLEVPRYVIPAPSAVVVAFADGLLHGATLHGLRVTLTEVLAGLDVGFTVALPGAIAAEFVGSSEGLGYAIMQQQFSVDLPGAFANLARLGLIGVIGHGVMAVLRRRMVVWDVA